MVESLRLRGDAVTCPCCERSFRRFARQGGDENARCPRCWSLPRQRALLLYLRERGWLDPGLSILHITPEEGLWRNLRGRARYVTADVQRGTRISHVFSVEEIPYPNDSFDLVLCSHVLEHVPDDRRALREFRRVVGPSGRALQHPVKLSLAETYEDPSIADPEERRRAYGQHDHLRLYGSDFGQRVASSGLNVERVPYIAQLEPAARARYGLHDDGPINSADLYIATPAAIR
jgi:SAM-dependent methyltransferase